MRIPDRMGYGSYELRVYGSHCFRAGRTLRYGFHRLLAGLVAGYIDIDLIQGDGVSGAGGLRLLFDLAFQFVHCPSLIDVNWKYIVVVAANNGAIKGWHGPVGGCGGQVEKYHMPPTRPLSA